VTVNERVPKIVGADVELSNFILGAATSHGTGSVASKMLLSAIVGVESGFAEQGHAIDWGRKYLPENGGCVYIDSDHLEIALPETFSAFDHLAYWRAMLGLARVAMRRVNERLREGYRLQVLANCSDGLGNSYGSHLNVLVTRSCWEAIIAKKPHCLAYLAAFQISSIVYAGQGKVGSECNRPPVDFQLSQRADFFTTLSSIDTMHQRGVINTRDESHCGLRDDESGAALARLHVIFFDSTLCQVATVLRVGTMQMITAMLEAGAVDTSLALDDPLEALEIWSRDPSLAATAPRVDGRQLTAVELQCLFLDAAKRFAARGGFDGTVPDAHRILALWEDTLVKLAARDFDTLSRRIDWVAKRRLLDGVLAERPSLTWQSPAIKQLDQLYASLDEVDGPFWALERTGQVDRVIADEAIDLAACEPPADTRAWTRAHLLRLAGDDGVERINWDRLHVRSIPPHSRYSRTRVVRLPVPFGSTRAQNERFFLDGASLESIVSALRAADLSPFEQEIRHEHA
jgi:proteasome accessory factor A